MLSLLQTPILAAFIFALLGYLSGSLSFALWITRAVKGVDVRKTGSKHATTTNTIRQAGFGPGIIVLILDISKGFLPVFLAVRTHQPDWIIGLTAAAAVAGHCWPLFAGFQGGMGLATTGGALLAVNWLAFLVGLAILIALTLGLKHGARASVITGLAIAPIFFLMGQRGAVLWIGVLAGVIIAIRFAIDWRREYKELWLDRTQAG
ncbi:MAG TPA: glycerol-3-phosphate acyltransferase [Anaerolineales bacterium]|nr:glycerol-3-phosphate acyltransferase [Anaerolineales bacterium]